METKFSFGRVVGLGGAFAASTIGCGFATGQEILQFFTVYGKGGLYGALVNTLIFIFLGAVFMRHGYEYALEDPRETAAFYFGKKCGPVAETVLQVFLFCIYVIMLSGASTLLHEFFGLPALLGRLLVAALVYVTVILGLKRFSTLLGGIGPLVIVLALFIGVFAILAGKISFGTETAQAAASVMPAASNWLFAAVLYPAFNAMAILFIICGLGAGAKSRKEAVLGGVFGGVLFGLAVLVMNLGLTALLPEVADQQIPTLAIAAKLPRACTFLFTVVISCGICAATVITLWSVVRHFAEDGTKKARILALILSAAGVLLAATDFKKLVNIIYPYSGYLGLVLILFTAVRLFRPKAPEGKTRRV